MSAFNYAPYIPIPLRSISFSPDFVFQQNNQRLQELSSNSLLRAVESLQSQLEHSQHIVTSSAQRLPSWENEVSASLLSLKMQIDFFLSSLKNTQSSSVEIEANLCDAFKRKKIQWETEMASRTEEVLKEERNKMAEEEEQKLLAEEKRRLAEDAKQRLEEEARRLRLEETDKLAAEEKRMAILEEEKRLEEEEAEKQRSALVEEEKRRLEELKQKLEEEEKLRAEEEKKMLEENKEAEERIKLEMEEEIRKKMLEEEELRVAEEEKSYEVKRREVEDKKKPQEDQRRKELLHRYPELSQLIDMGFTDIELNVQLLQKYKNDFSAVIDELTNIQL